VLTHEYLLCILFSNSLVNNLAFIDSLVIVSLWYHR